MVVESLRSLWVVAVVAVVVVAAVRPVVGVERPHAKWAKQDLFDFAERRPCVVRVKHLGCHHHGDCKVGTQLVVGPGLAGVVRVFVNATAVDKLWTQLVLRSRRPVDPELTLEVVRDFVFPLRKRPSCVASWNGDSIMGI